MEKRVLLALMLSFLVLGFYPVLLEKMYPGYQAKTSRGTQEASKTTLPASKGAVPPSVLTKTAVGAFSAQEDLDFQTDRLKLVWNRKAAAIRDISLLKFMDAEKKAPIHFLSAGNPQGALTAVLLTETDFPVADSPPSYEISAVGADSVRASAVISPSVKIRKTYSFHPAGYGCDLGIDFENNSNSPVSFRYQVLAGSGIIPRHSIDGQYIEANFYLAAEGNRPLRHLRETKLGKSVASPGPVRWVAVKDRHFSVILRPPEVGAFAGLVQGLGNNDFSASVLSEKIALPPGGRLRHDFLLYIGPNTLEDLEPLGLGPIVNFGKLDAIGKLLVGGLELFHKFLRNYGLAIIVMTVFINILLFPLTRVSFQSMKRMQLIQPHMSKLKEQHKKNPEKLNKEMMELYKKHKVNPFGGCLPMILQMPVFMALYVALSKSVILIHSKFLWVSDLSSPDIVWLPFALPFLGNQIHVLPLIMVAGMVVQQKFTQVKMEGQDPALESQQKMMAIMMPIVFGFIFYAMPSGLVLYWLTNTVLMTLYQLYLKKAAPA